MKKKLGLIVNPVAGVGGRVGLKGSDGEEILKKALELGATPESPRRAMDALERLAVIKDEIDIITYPHEMGEQEARDCGFEPEVLGSIQPGKTGAKDTIDAAKTLAAMNADLILFAGGDGTARNIYDAIGNTNVPVIGIPAGVKIHSAVYATNSRNAGEVALMYLQGKIKKVHDAEVMDIDEAAFREGRVTAKLYGYLKVPHEAKLVQGLKSGRTEGEATALNYIADDVIENMAEDIVYVIGPGTTTRAVMQKLGLQNTLLGVDVIMNKKVLANDVTESRLLELTKGKRTKIVVTIIGGQGYIFGRGNQQISPRVLKEVGKDNIIVIAPQSKLTALGGNPLLIDTGNYEVNNMLSGYYKVVIGLERTMMRKAE
ncbi:ATP-NAD kinase family protein [Phosphitispora fastidiosa]|uniref:ATP-NAD kinase family protein n=1 Tax=Phosphitispora fastidiosa TaxID=2837202 RepID=UPI001E44A4E5|nr:ATP-NAD kinase family protein [Phosphitispora fastidiosa]MBU7005750.1 putative polyphosphate/ATP-dependent NAD kinase [Phosphitispora fastidiosa]